MNFITFPVCQPTHRKAEIFSRAFTITDRKKWLARYDNLKAIIARNPLLTDFINQEYKIEMGVGFALERYKKVQVFPSLRMHPELYEAISFLYILYQVYSKIGAGARERLDGMVRDGLNKNRGVASLAFELAIAAHCVSNGYSVWLKDLDGYSSPDMLARKDDVTIEIECKHISGEIGYPIHKIRFLELIHLQMSAIQECLSSSEITLALLVTIPQRLHNDEGYYRRLSELIAGGLMSRRSIQDDHGNEVRITLLQTPRWLEQWNATTFARMVLKNVYGVDNNNAIVVGERGGPCVIIGMVSKQEPRVLGRLFQQLRDSAKRQLSGQSPGLLCAYLSAVSTSDLRDLSGQMVKRTGLELAVNDFFERRPHVSALSFMTSDQPMWFMSPADRSLRVLRQNNAALLFSNHRAPQPITESMGLFPDMPWQRIR